MAFLSSAKDYVNDLCTDVCESIQSGSSTIVQSVRTWCEQASSPLKLSKTSGSEGESTGGLQFNVSHPSAKVYDPPCWLAYETQHVENSKTQEEYRKLRMYIEQLAQDYQLSKDKDAFRRYGLLKTMIKRTVLLMQLSANDEEARGSGPRGAAVNKGQQKENERKIRQRLQEMSDSEVQAETKQLVEHTKLLRVKICMIRDHIEELDKAYQNSKHLVAVLRYKHMKDMIKALINNQWVKD